MTFFLQKPQKLAIRIRYPEWLRPGTMKLAVNGSTIPIRAAPGAYAEVERTWRTGDRMEVTWPLTLRTEMLPKNQEWVSVLWGPVVLAGELGNAGLAGLDFSATHKYIATEVLPLSKAPVFIGGAGDVLAKVKRLEGPALRFRTEGLAAPADVSLVPFYTLHRQRYAIYWRLMSQADYGAGRPSDAETADDK